MEHASLIINCQDTTKTTINSILLPTITSKLITKCVNLWGVWQKYYRGVADVLEAGLEKLAPTCHSHTLLHCLSVDSQ